MTSFSNSNKPKVIFYAPILEYPPAGGPQISVANAIKVLSRISELHIITVVPAQKHDYPEVREFLSRHTDHLTYAPSSILYSKNPTIERAIRIFRRLCSPLIATVDSRFISQYVRKNAVDVIWIDRVIEHSFSLFKSLRRKFPKLPIVGDTEAVHSRFILRELPFIKNPIRKLWIYSKGKKAEFQERELVDKADVVTAVSDIDVSFYKSISKSETKVLKFSNVIDLADFEEEYLPKIELNQPSALLLGSFGHANSPMDRAAKWLADEIMPIVWAKVPSAHLYIIGRNSQITLAKLNSENITVVGQVNSVVPYLQQATITLVPLRFESGTRFKIIESGAASVACVSTTLGAEGLAVTPGDNILIGDTTFDFANAMISLLSNPDVAKIMGSKLHECISKNYSIETQTIEGKEILNYLKIMFHE